MVAVLLVPHLALSTAIFFALVCVGMLIYFVDHMASRINVDTVIELVSADLRTAFQRLTSEEPCPVDCGVYVRTPASGHLMRYPFAGHQFAGIRAQSRHSGITFAHFEGHYKLRPPMVGPIRLTPDDPDVRRIAQRIHLVP